MGGFTNVLGHAAAGFNQAAQIDKQNQFDAEMEHRKDVTGLLQKLAFDETATPEARSAALNEIGNVHATPITKPYKFDPYKSGIIRSAQTRSITSPGVSAMPAPPGQQPSFTDTSIPLPPGVSGPPQLGPPQMSMPMPTPPSMAGAGAASVTNTSPAGAFMSPQEVTQMTAQRAGAVTAAQAREQMAAPIYTQSGPGEPFTAVPLSHAGTPMGAGVANATPPGMLQGRGLRSAKYVDPNTGQVQLGTQNLFTHEILDQNGDVVPNAVPFEPSLVTKQSQSSQSMDAAGGIHTTRTTGPAAGGPGTGNKGGQGKPQGSPHITSGTATNWANDNYPVALAAQRWATQGQAPKGGAMAERQVLSYMKQHGLEPALPVPPSLQRAIQQSFVARNSAIGLIDTIQKNSDVLNSLVSAGKIQTAINPSSGAAFVTRAVGLNDKEETVAQAYQQLVEHVNLLRGPLGATGFRGPEAWAALQAQRGNLMSDPRITRDVLAGFRDRLVGLNSADKMVLSGHGMDAGGVPTPPVDSSASTKKQAYRVGDKWFDAATHTEIR